MSHNTSKSWISITIKPEDNKDTENISSILYALGFLSQVFETDGSIIIYTRNKNYFEKIKKHIDSCGISFRIKSKKLNMEWQKKLHGDFTAVEAGDFVIVAEGYKDDYKGAKKRIIINPAQAFGSGQHPTTHQCLMLIQKVMERHIVNYFLEPGCGSSILSIAAKKLGTPYAEAFDIDSDAIINAEENQKLNNVKVNTFCSEIVPLKNQYDLVCANILSHVLVNNAETLMSYVKPDKFIILSGIEDSQTEEVFKAFNKYKLYKKLSYEGWTSLVYTKSLLAD
ncbi:MAG: 50S ribosomal protein L11 methyltransferase [Candidatus Muiribacteriota bacterium]